MKNTSTTMKMDLVYVKSHYLLRIFQQLPDKKLKEVLPSPRSEFVRDMKSRIRYSLEEIKEC